MKKLFYQIKRFFKWLKFQQDCKIADELYYFHFGSCFSLFPPSFYMKHTPEEVDRITKESLERIRKKIDELED